MPQRECDDLVGWGGGLGIANEFQGLYGASSEFKVTLLNLTPLSFTVDGIRVASLAADACQLPFPDRAYDWVFSNAVIEHVGDLNRQAMLANEIRRVARRGCFVTTPNRLFPIEAHTLFPFYQFLSPRNQRIALKFSVGYVREWEDIQLLSRSELQDLFPEAEICGMGPPVLPTTLVAYHRS